MCEGITVVKLFYNKCAMALTSNGAAMWSYMKASFCYWNLFGQHLILGSKFSK